MRASRLQLPTCAGQGSKVLRWGSRGCANFIVFQGIIKGKGLQTLVQILYQILDKTRNVVLQVDSGGFSVLSTKFVPGNWSPFPLIIPWETMKLPRQNIPPESTANERDVWPTTMKADLN